MTTSEHEPECDGTHTMRQPCNARGRREQPAEATMPAAVLDDPSDRGPATAVVTEEASGADRDQRQELLRRAGYGSAPRTVDARGDDLRVPTSPRAIADGPLEPIDTGGFPILALIGIAAAMVALLVVAVRLLRGPRPRD